MRSSASLPRWPILCSWWSWTSPATVGKGPSCLAGGGCCLPVCAGPARVHQGNQVELLRLELGFPGSLCGGGGWVGACLVLRSSPSLTPACLWAAVLQTFQRFPRASSSASPWRLPTSAETPCPGRGEASACPSERVSLTRGDLARVVGEMAAWRFCPAGALGLLCECSVGGTEVPCPKRAEAEGAGVALSEVKMASAKLGQLPLLWGLESPKDQLP